jgi:hypothetical protein
VTKRTHAAALTLALGAAIAMASTPVRSDDPVSSSVRFTGDIVRIFDRKCQPCHANGGLAMPLSNYRDVRAWGRAIREEIVEQRMPPWTAARGYGRFKNDLSLSARETATILSWIDGGMARGDDRDLPPAQPSTAGVAPDVRIALPPQRVPAEQDHVIRQVSVAAALDPGRTIARVVFVPGARQVARAALLFATEAGGDRHWIGAWLPWQPATEPPAAHGFRVPRGSHIALELHYRGGDQEIVDASSLEVYYATPPARPIAEVALHHGTTARLAESGTVWAIIPSTGAVAASLQLTARRPDGSTEVMLWMPQIRHDWPQALVLDAPLVLPAGTTLALVSHPADPAAAARVSLLR